MGWDSFFELLLFLLYFSAALKAFQQYQKVEPGNSGSWLRKLLICLLTFTIVAKLLLELIFLVDLLPLQIEEGMYFLTASGLIFLLFFESYSLFLIIYRAQELQEMADTFSTNPSKWKMMASGFALFQAAILASILLISDEKLFQLLNNCTLCGLVLLFSSLAFLSTRAYREILEIDPQSRNVRRLRKKLKSRHVRMIYAIVLRCAAGMIVWIKWFQHLGPHRAMLLDIFDCILLMVIVQDMSQDVPFEEEVQLNLAQESKPRELTERLMKDESPSNRPGFDLNGISPQNSKLGLMVTPPPEKNPDADITPRAKNVALA